ncbi:MAG: LamG-like jellyroll fold domain-containing protein [Pirellulaceae bacterium]
MIDFDREKFLRMLFDHESDTLSPDAAQAFRHLLLHSPEAQREFAEWQSVNALIAFEDSALLPKTSTTEASDTVGNRELKAGAKRGQSVHVQLRESRLKRMNIGGILAVAFALLAAVLGFRLLQVESESKRARPGDLERVDARKDLKPQTGANSETPSSIRNTPPPQDVLLSRGVALVTRLVDTVEDVDSTPQTWLGQAIQSGQAIVPGPLTLEAGIAQIEFYCGATLIVEGPAELEILSSQSIRCVRGKIQAVVPPAARGFEVLVDDSKIIDLGTEFGLSVSAEGTDLKVYDGEVELQHSAGERTNLLTAGESAKWQGDELPVTSDTASELGPQSRLVDVERFRDRARGIADSRFERWKTFSESLRSDDRLIAYYSMEEPSAWERKTLDARLPRQPDLDAAIVGANPTEGRWTGKQAYEFKHPGDRIRVQIPGDFSSLTFVCWVRIDSLDRWYNSLFLTDNYQRGEPHWQILNSGQLFFSVRVSEGAGGPEHKEVKSPIFWKPSMSGEWLNLATTYDVENAITSHYLNGELLSSDEIPDSKLVEETRIGLASIGNWSAPTKPNQDFAIRNLNGRMDELMIFNSALAAEEIQEIYSNGKP